MSTNSETPENAAERLVAAKLPDGFAIEAVHAYTDPDGSPLYWRIRAKNSSGGKWIRPMKRSGARYVLKEPSFKERPNGKPLFQLHEIAKRDDKTVIVVEGEMKADKLAALGLLVTTSGSAQSAGSADWQPLCGRDVMIWPDNDEAGRKYGQAVADLLLGQGCTVRIVDVAALGLQAKGDAADWLSLNPDATASDVFSLKCYEAIELGLDVGSPVNAKENDSSFPSKPDSPNGAEFDNDVDEPNTCKVAGGQYKFTENGVFFVGVDAGRDGKPASTWVCSPLGIIAKTRNSKSLEWGRLLEWFDDDGMRHRWAIPLEWLEGDGVDARKELARRGLRIGTSRKAKELLIGYIKNWPTDRRVRSVERLGWHGAVYALPTETIGDSSEDIVFQNTHSIEPAHEARGSVDSWRESVGALAAGNTRPVFAVSTAFAGPLFDVVAQESGGFHLRGESSSGKSTALKAAASVWGNPDKYVRQWRATTNGMEGLAAVHNDSLLILDELSQCDPKQAGEAAYMLANGQGKVRANQKGAARASQTWRLAFLSSGEVPLSTLMAQVGRQSNVGQEVRMADFEADAGVGKGAFEDTHGYPDGAAFSVAMKDAALENHGAVGREWLRSIVKVRTQLAELISERLEQFIAEVVPKGSAGQIARVARRFGIVAVAGELATDRGLTGWTKGEAEQAAKVCFASWLEGFGGTGNREERDSLFQIRAFFEKHGASRFEAFEVSEDRPIVNRAGFFRTYENAEPQYLVLPEVFKLELCSGRDHKSVERLLLARGWIVPGGDGRATQKPRLPVLGTTARVYVFSPKLWEDEI